MAELNVGANESTVTLGDGRVVRLALGYAGVPATLFRESIPTALELERAIAAVEDEVMPAVPQLAGVGELASADARLRAWAEAESGGVLPLARVEWLFDELSRASLGGPASALPFAPAKATAATLVILRELMHHAGIRAVRCEVS